jgi:predicted HAD superfamily Cof-like phosphohydrolase
MITQEDIEAFKDMQEPVPQMGLHNMPKDWDHPHSTPLQMVRDFATAMDQPLDKVWQEDTALENLRWSLIAELADLVYVVYGYAATYGWDLDKALRRVHWSNMSKLGLDGKPLKNETGKVIKGPNYKQPDLTNLVETSNEQ